MNKKIKPCKLVGVDQLSVFLLGSHTEFEIIFLKNFYNNWKKRNYTIRREIIKIC